MYAYICIFLIDTNKQGTFCLALCGCRENRFHGLKIKDRKNKNKNWSAESIQLFILTSYILYDITERNAFVFADSAKFVHFISFFQIRLHL
jgi:hypothetical protein